MTGKLTTAYNSTAITGAAAPSRPPTVPIPEPPRAPVESEGLHLGRYLSALYRFKWLILAMTAAGMALGVFAARSVVPQYEVYAGIWLSAESPQARAAGPIRAGQLLSTDSWPELIRSFVVLEKVVRARRLYIDPARGTPAELFSTFEIADRFKTGHYELRVTGGRYELLDAVGGRIESGAVGDSIGRAIGFRWAPSAELLRQTPVAKFAVTTPRDAAVELRERFDVYPPGESNIMRMLLRGSDPRQITETLETILAEFLATASSLKTSNLAEFAKTLDQQLAYAAQEMRAAEIALEEFRVRTITLPAEGSAGIAAGLEMTRDPVMSHYFDQKLQLDSIKNDRESLERAIAAIGKNQLTVHALQSIPAVHTSPALTSVLTDYSQKQAALRAEQERFTDQYQGVVEKKAALERLETQTIPRLATELRDNLRRRELDLQSRVDASSRDLRQIPTRTIEEMRLRRTVEIRTQFYTMLRGRYEEARLAEASATPDVRVFDYPSLPELPSRNTAPQILMLAVLGSLGAAVITALLLDRLDRRFRYPDQATNELGLDILGVVPRIRTARSKRAREEQAWQVTEAFRMLRLGVTHAHAGAGPLSVTISSPGTGDGKSLTAANLALSFSGAGYRTVLIDGDVRRGLLHTYFRLPSGQPGLTDYLNGQATLDSIVQSTDAGLSLIPSGSRARGAPELLASRTMPDTIETLRARFDVIIIDSAPLGAGIDPFVLGTWTGNLLLVLRAGQTDRKMAEAKLRLLDRLPVRVLGAVLNAVRTKGEYRYYNYSYGYEDENGNSRKNGRPRFTELVKSISRLG